MSLCELTISEAVREINDRAVSCRELVESCLDQIAALEPSVAAWARVQPEQALAEADRLDVLDPNVKARMPLCGVPVGIKDIVATEGLETSAGSRILAGWVPRADATVVRRLRSSGAVVLGKTATTEFAGPDPAPTRNPFDLEHTPGGSSAGSAAALAADMCLGTIGTQTAGSVIRPAAYCGVVGFKPTYDAVSRRGVLPLAWSLDHVGPLARTVTDAARLFGQIANAPSAGARRLKSLRTIGVPDRFFDDATPDVASACEDALKTLDRLGYRVRPVSLAPSFAAAAAAARVVLPVETAAAHERWFDERRDEYGPHLRAVVELGRRISGPDYVQAQRARRVAALDMERVLDDVDMIATPAIPAPAPHGLSSTGDPRFNSPFSSLGLPALGVPVPAGGRLPVSIQLVAEHGFDDAVLAVGRQLEQRLEDDGWSWAVRRSIVRSRLHSADAPRTPSARQ